MKFRSLNWSSNSETTGTTFKNIGRRKTIVILKRLDNDFFLITIIEVMTKLTCPCHWFMGSWKYVLAMQSFPDILSLRFHREVLIVGYVFFILLQARKEYRVHIQMETSPFFIFA